MKLELDRIIKFTQLLNKFREVERVIHSNGGDRLENDVEHSYQLSMLAWYIISTHNLDLDIDLVLKYSLAHDLVEVYAGDTYIYSEDTSLLESKVEREEESFKQLQAEFPEFSELFEIIKQYEKREDKEARFVYSLDKIEAVLSIYTGGGRTWKEKEITIKMLIENKKKKVAESPELIVCFDELIDLLKENEVKLFGCREL